MLFLLQYGAKKIVVLRPSTYESAIDIAHAHFKDLPTEQIRLYSCTLPGHEGKSTELTQKSWKDSIGHVTQLQIVVVSQAEIDISGQAAVNRDQDKCITVQAELYPHVAKFRLKPQTPVGRLYQAIHRRFGTRHDPFGFDSDHQIFWDGRRLPNTSETVDEFGLSDGDTIDVCWSQLGGWRDNLILVSPTNLEPVLKLELSPWWKNGGSFYSLSPPDLIRRVAGSSDSQVPDIFEHQWELKMSQTEASHNNCGFYSTTNETFRTGIHWNDHLDPQLQHNASKLSDDNSVVLSALPITSLQHYLSDALHWLQVPECLADDSMYLWPRQLTEYTHVAIRFLSQEEASVLAKLTVTPFPDVTIRIYMIAEPVPVEDLGKWPEAVKREALGGQYWRDKIGVAESDFERMRRSDLFRVFECRGLIPKRKMFEDLDYMS